ncbi:MAG: alpha/beta fold hydrolase [Planctomycetes bacterium]|nr:alpha/beta fold hydrolase [Planctomycetota bacterium]
MSRMFWFLVLIAATHVSAFAQDRPPANRPTVTLRPPHLLVVLIGGIDSDPTPAQIAGTAERQAGNSGLYQFARDIAADRVLPEYFNWNGTRAGQIKLKTPPRARGIADVIDQHLQAYPHDRVALVGNSWGGHTALEVLQDLVLRETPLAVHLAVFLDPSSTGRGPPRPKALPINVQRAVSYCTRNAFVWGPWDAGPRLENIDLGDPARGFIKNGQPPYDAKFNTQAHIAAEWDPRIHEDIQQRVQALLPD